MSDESAAAQHVGLEGLAAQFIAGADANAEGVPTGYSIDETCGKQRPGELAALLARPSVGKSTLVTNFIVNAAVVPTMFFSLEMPPEQLLGWLVPMSQELPCSQREVESVLANHADKRRPAVLEAVQATARMFGATLDIQRPSSAPSISDLVRAVDDFVMREGVEVRRVFIDHLFLMRGYEADKRSVDAITNALKAWAVTDRIAITFIQHTVKAGEVRNDGHLPVALSSGLYGGDAACDWIYGAYRPEMDPRFADDSARERDAFRKVQNVTRFQVVKNRPYGETNPRGIDLVYEDRTRRLVER